jgi:hypothetical protein
MPVLVTALTRVVVTSLLLVLAAAGTAEAQSVAECINNPIPKKTIRIYNADPLRTLYPIIERGDSGLDNWLLALC